MGDWVGRLVRREESLSFRIWNFYLQSHSGTFHSLKTKNILSAKSRRDERQPSNLNVFLYLCGEVVMN